MNREDRRKRAKLAKRPLSSTEIHAWVRTPLAALESIEAGEVAVCLIEAVQNFVVFHEKLAVEAAQPAADTLTARRTLNAILAGQAIEEAELQHLYAVVVATERLLGRVVHGTVDRVVDSMSIAAELCTTSERTW